MHVSKFFTIVYHTVGGKTFVDQYNYRSEQLESIVYLGGAKFHRETFNLWVALHKIHECLPSKVCCYKVTVQNLATFSYSCYCFSSE